MQSLRVPAGTTIFRTGDPSEAVFIIHDGEVAITIGESIEIARLFASRSGSATTR